MPERGSRGIRDGLLAAPEVGRVILPCRRPLIGIAGVTASLLVTPMPAAAQHETHGVPDSSRVRWHWGAHAVGLVTRVAPAVSGRSLAEWYLTQPEIMGGVGTRNGALSLATTISLEGLTLDDGELGPGAFGEGYVDRRHPHTYLHELLATATTDPSARFAASLTAGRGFAPFGTDDPMIRPFVKFPVNHHLSQVLERLVLIGAVRGGPLTLEVGPFGGNEPLTTRDLGDPDRFGDSWSARITMRPRPQWEIQASRAYVNSPEEPTGQDTDRRKWSASARYDGVAGPARGYALAEWSRSTIVAPRGDVASTASVLAEVSVSAFKWNGGVRLESTERHEGMREGAFRAPWPPTEHLIIGITTWKVVSVRAQRDLQKGILRVAPFAEGSLSHVTSSPGLFDAREFYGATSLWTLNAGLRLDLGMGHDRMGRYGVALPPAAQTGL